MGVAGLDAGEKRGECRLASPPLPLTCLGEESSRPLLGVRDVEESHRSHRSCSPEPTRRCSAAVSK